MQKTVQPQTTSQIQGRDASARISGEEPKIPEWKLEEGDAEVVGRLLAGKAVTQVEEERVRGVVQKRLYVLQGLLFAGSGDAYRLAVKTAQAETGRVIKELERRHFSVV